MNNLDNMFRNVLHFVSVGCKAAHVLESVYEEGTLDMCRSSNLPFTKRCEKQPTNLANWKANRALTRVRHVKPTQLKFKVANWKANRALKRVRHVKPTQLQIQNSAPLSTGLSMMFEILTIYPGHLQGLHDHTSRHVLTRGFQIQPLKWHRNPFIKEPKTYRVHSTRQSVRLKRRTRKT